MGGGGKSSSSTDQAQTTLSADGLVSGQVINVSSKGRTDFAYTQIDEFPEAVREVFSELLSLTGQTIDKAFAAGEVALTTATTAATEAAQPDLAVVKNTQNYVPLLVAGMVAIVVAFVWKGR